MDPKLYAGRHIRAIFHANRPAIASTNSPEKKKKEKSKPTEKNNITPDFEKFHFYKNGNIITSGPLWNGTSIG